MDFEICGKDWRLLTVHFTGALSVALAAWWTAAYDGGLNWQNPAHRFNFHPLLMLCAMVVLQGEAVLVYRLFRRQSKRLTKGLHVAIQTTVIAMVVVGLKAVFDSHNYNIDKATGEPKPSMNLYSLHSWLGVIVLVTFLVQYIVGLSAFLLPVLPPSAKRLIMPRHQTIGLLLFVLAVVTALMGIAENFAFKLPKCIPHHTLCNQVYIVNFLGLTVVLFAVNVIYVLTDKRLRRVSLPEETPLQEAMSQE